MLVSTPAWRSKGIVTGTEIILRGAFDTVTFSCSTLDPGEEIDSNGVMPKTVDGRPLLPTTIWVEGVVRDLVLRRSICGPIRTRGTGAIKRISATDSIMQGVHSWLPGLLASTEIADIHRLARRLKNGVDALTTYLRSSFTAPALVAPAAYDPPIRPMQR